MNNPFDISFGKKPAETISRFRQSHEITDTFSSETITQQLYMITGVRGSGKTVLMNMIANSLEADKRWIVLRLNPERDLLLSMASKLASHQESVQLFQSTKLNLSAFGLGIEVAGTAPILDLETAIEKMLSALSKKGKRVLITIDEVTNNAYLKVFCSSFQIFTGQELPLFLLMTGLYENIDNLQNEKSLTFLYRAPKLKMEPLNIGMIATRYEEIFHVERSTSLQLANLTRGYPFAFQALGFSIWNHGTQMKDFLPEYRQLLDEYVYEKIWSELSEKDRTIADGIARSDNGKIRQINELLDLKPNEINQYRSRLIKKGIVDGDHRGYLRFTLPLFADFVTEHSFSFI